MRSVIYHSRIGRWHVHMVEDARNPCEPPCCTYFCARQPPKWAVWSLKERQWFGGEWSRGIAGRQGGYHGPNTIIFEFKLRELRVQGFILKGGEMETHYGIIADGHSGRWA